MGDLPCFPIPGFPEGKDGSRVAAALLTPERGFLIAAVDFAIAAARDPRPIDAAAPIWPDAVGWLIWLMRAIG
jgi:hypothetical protein